MAVADNSYLTDSSFDQNSSAMDDDSGRDTAMSVSSGCHFTRESSLGSFPPSSTSSPQNTDDEDSDTCRSFLYKQRRRESHINAEQKRRDAIKKGYEELQELVPTCQPTDNNTIAHSKISKAGILQKTIDYIQFLTQQRKKQDDDLDTLRKEVTALNIMKQQYEEIVQVHRANPIYDKNEITDEMKFQIFQEIMDKLFITFDGNVNTDNFDLLAKGVFHWLEEFCEPITLGKVVFSVLDKTELPTS